MTDGTKQLVQAALDELYPLRRENAHVQRAVDNLALALQEWDKQDGRVCAGWSSPNACRGFRPQTGK